VDGPIRFIERITGSVGILASLAIVPLVLATCYEVFARYLMGAPTIWAYEVGYILTGSHFLLGMAYTLRQGAHIRIDIFSGHFSSRTRAMIDLAAYAVILPMMIWLSVTLYQHLMTGFLRGERSGQSALNLPVWPFRVIFLIAFVLLAVQLLIETIKAVRRLRAGK
jgi:TRAP-type mannitol/chloroaromatic compound transport system permease small subunit